MKLAIKAKLIAQVVATVDMTKALLTGIFLRNNIDKTLCFILLMTLMTSAHVLQVKILSIVK